MNRREFSILSILSAGLAFLPPRSAEAEMFVPPSPCGPLPELPVAPSPEVDQKLFAGFTAEDVKTSGATIRVFRKKSGPPLLLHAACEDYRAAAELDLEMDNADDDAGHKITAPLLALWGAKGTVGPSLGCAGHLACKELCRSVRPSS